MNHVYYLYINRMCISLYNIEYLQLQIFIFRSHSVFSLDMQNHSTSIVKRILIYFIPLYLQG